MILRSPALNYQDYGIENRLKLLLSDQQFKVAISFASKSLYDELVVSGFSFNKLNDKVRHTLLKYYNRMSYRPTPFGQFAGIAALPWGEGEPLIKEDCDKLHIAYSFTESKSIADQLVACFLNETLTYKVNDSIYSLNGSYRYLQYGYEEKSDKRVFFLHTTEGSKELKILLDYLRRPQTSKEICSFISRSFSLSPQQSAQLLSELLEEQLLSPVFQVNITGEDYLKIVTGKCEAIARNQVQKMQDSFRSRDKEIERLYYVNVENKIKGSLDVKYQQNIREGLAAIDRLTPFQQHPRLSKFTEQFTKKFDRQLVPLMLAIDPEVGISYESLATEPCDSALLKDVSITKKNDNNKVVITWSAAHTLLMEQWNKQIRSERQATIVLTDELLNGLPIRQDHEYPQSFSVLFRVLGEQIYLEQAGGTTGTALSGRFSLFDEHIWQECQRIAALEEKANPDVLFAEVSHIGDYHTANIERRKSFYSYEIPILTGSAMPEERQILLSDLFLKVEDGMICLWSAKLKKVIIPRFSSAFNYLRDDLAVFRFLCDLQHQRLKSNFTLDLEQFFPGLQFYPRVQFKNCLLSLARWQIRKDRFLELSKCPTASLKTACLEQWRDQLHWPRYISLDEHDHQLVFDTMDRQSLLFLAENLKNATAALIREFPFCGKVDSPLQDHNGKPYINQFSAVLYHEGRNYPVPKLSGNAIIPPSQIQRKYAPGSEWLYYKIYCHPSRSNEILTRYLLPYLQSQVISPLVLEWFFVRYRDPDYHLRIRLHIAPESTIASIKLLEHKFAGLVTTGIISNLQMEVYDREIERYQLMKPVERLFCSSSALIMSFLSKVSTDEGDLRYYEMGFNSILKITTIFKISTERKISIFKNLFESLATEFGAQQKLADQFKRKYRELRNNPYFFTDAPRYLKIKDVRHKQTNFDINCDEIATLSVDWPQEDRIKLFVDLVHMHLNRLLVDNSRRQELLIYYCLWRNYQSENGKELAFRKGLSPQDIFQQLPPGTPDGKSCLQ